MLPVKSTPKDLSLAPCSRATPLHPPDVGNQWVHVGSHLLLKPQPLDKATGTNGSSALCGSDQPHGTQRLCDYGNEAACVTHTHITRRVNTTHGNGRLRVLPSGCFLSTPKTQPEGFISVCTDVGNSPHFSSCGCHFCALAPCTALWIATHCWTQWLAPLSSGSQAQNGPCQLFRH